MNKEKNNSITICDECKSEYYRHSSKMANLCPECSHILYGYENCDHQFEMENVLSAVGMETTQHT